MNTYLYFKNRVHFSSFYFHFIFVISSLLTEREGRVKRHRIHFVMAYKCCAVHCLFNYSGEEVAAIFSFPRDVHISKFSSITRLKI